MAFNHNKSATYRLGQTAKALRARTGSHLQRVGLHPGQELVLKVLAEENGQTMSQLASMLNVQPPTVTKMVGRLSAQEYVERRTSAEDGRQARVFLTEKGQLLISAIDKSWKRLEREAMSGLEEKDRKKLKKLLKQVEQNLASSPINRPEFVKELEDDVLDAENLGVCGELETA